MTRTAPYALPAVVIAVGSAETNFGGHTVQWFGVELPRVFPETADAVHDLPAEVHMWLAYSMLVIAAGHVAAAYKRRWIDGHDVIRRMPFRGALRRSRAAAAPRLTRAPAARMGNPGSDATSDARSHGGSGPEDAGTATAGIRASERPRPRSCPRVWNRRLLLVDDWARLGPGGAAARGTGIGLPGVPVGRRRRIGLRTPAPVRPPVPGLRDLSALRPRPESAKRLTLGRSPPSTGTKSRPPPSRRSRRPSRQPLRGAWRRP